MNTEINQSIIQSINQSIKQLRFFSLSPHEEMSEWINEWMNDWMDEWMNEWTNGGLTENWNIADWVDFADFVSFVSFVCVTATKLMSRVGWWIKLWLAFTILPVSNTWGNLITVITLYFS